MSEVRGMVWEFMWEAEPGRTVELRAEGPREGEDSSPTGKDSTESFSYQHCK